MELIIEDAGYSLRLPKLGLIRTPCKIEFSVVDINTLIMTLKAEGISKYKIVEDASKNTTHILPKNSKAIKAKKPEKVIIERATPSISNSIELNKLNKKFDKLMDGVQQLIKDGPVKSKSFTKSVSINNKPKVEKLNDEFDDEFVPEISLDGMEISSSKNKEIFVESDAVSSADILRELKGENK